MEKHIKNQKNNSILYHFYKKICNLLLLVVPNTISPVFISFIGFLSVLISSIVVTNFKEKITILNCSIICSLSLLLYQFMRIMSQLQVTRIDVNDNLIFDMFCRTFDSVVVGLIIYNFLDLTKITGKYYEISVLLYVIIFTNFYLDEWQSMNTDMVHFEMTFDSTELLAILQVLYIVIGTYNHILQNIIIIEILIIIVITGTIYNIFCIISYTIKNYKKGIYNLSASFVVILFCYCSIGYLLYRGTEIHILSLMIPLKIAFLNLVWCDICDTRYEIFYVAMIFILNIIPGCFSIIISLILYFNLLNIYYDKLCEKM